MNIKKKVKKYKDLFKKPATQTYIYGFLSRSIYIVIVSGMRKFKVVAPYEPAGDQPAGYTKTCRGILQREISTRNSKASRAAARRSTMAKIIEAVQRPTLIISHNKTLSAQLSREFKRFFPDNAVEYFVSYYDYYQPETYVPCARPLTSKKTRRLMMKSTN